MLVPEYIHVLRLYRWGEYKGIRVVGGEYRIKSMNYIFTQARKPVTLDYKS